MSRPRRPGPPRIDAAAFAPPNPGDRPHGPPPVTTTPKSSVVVVNADLLARFRSHCAAIGESPTNAILAAHVELGEQVQDALKPTAADRRRITLGVPQAAASARLGPGNPLSLWLSPTSVAELTAAAAGTGISRRRYITALIETLLTGTDDPA